MRKIEEEMLKATREGKSVSLGNTTITIENGGYGVLLHGYCIAHGKIGETPYEVNLCGYDTNTTRSRLRALGVNITRKNYEPYINGRKIPVNGWVLAG